jgi:hypothetical protein
LVTSPPLLHPTSYKITNLKTKTEQGFPESIYGGGNLNEYWQATCPRRAGDSEENFVMIRLPGVALGLMMAALSSHSNAKGISSPSETTTQDEFAAQQATPMAVAQKVCVIMKAPTMGDSGWVSVTPVPSTWTIATCQRLATAGDGNQGLLGCFFDNSYSFGAKGWSKPSPNCGWK